MSLMKSSDCLSLRTWSCTKLMQIMGTPNTDLTKYISSGHFGILKWLTSIQNQLFQNSKAIVPEFRNRRFRFLKQLFHLFNLGCRPWTREQRKWALTKTGACLGIWNQWVRNAGWFSCLKEGGSIDEGNKQRMAHNFTTSTQGLRSITI